MNNATLQEYDKGKVKDDCKVILVARHKRAKNGPAICPMLSELYKFMNIHTKRIRPHLANSDEDALLVTNDGTAFNEGTIGRRLPSFVDKCGVHLGSRMAFVDMRNIITTEVLRRASKAEEELLPLVLAHSEKTSRDWYSCPNLTELGIKAAKIIERLMDPDDKSKFQSRSGSQKEEEEEEEEDITTSEKDLISPSASQQQADAGPSFVSEPVVQPASPPNPPRCSSTRPTP